MSRWFISASLILLSWPAPPAGAQTSAFRGPLAGWVYSRSARTLRPILGVPGAARIGSPLLSHVDFASIAPDGNWALIVRAGHSSLINGIATQTPLESPVSGFIDAVERVVWNRDGSAAVLYSAAANQLQRVQFSGAAATPDAPLDLSPWGTPAALAIDPAGRQIAFGIVQSGLYVFSGGQSPALLSTMAQPAAAAFDSSGRLYAFDADQQQIIAFDASMNPSTFASLAQPGVPAVAPAGLALSGDGRYLLLADSAAQAVRIYDTGSAALTRTIPLDFAPTRFEALSSTPTILLNGDRAHEWLLMLDAGQLPHLVFVPASQETVNE